jgi:hypothetical protein
MKTLITPTKFADNPYQPEWFERDYLVTPDGTREFPKHHCKRTFQVSFPFIRRMRTAVDIGCRVGEYSRYLQHHFARTYAFDPNRISTARSVTNRAPSRCMAEPIDS